MSERIPQESIEELCEEIWSLSEADQATVGRLTGGSKVPEAAKVLEELAGRGLAGIEEGRVVLSAEGSALARTIVRRHRLAEVLFHGVLAIEESVTEATACAVEHVLPEPVTDSLCAYLGHPARCPHGKPIPKGPCCGLHQEPAPARVVKLTDLPVGTVGRIVFITTRVPPRLSALGALGLAPGREVRLVQRLPSVVLEAGHTTVAIDPEIAAEIVVVPEPSAPPKPMG